MSFLLLFNNFNFHFGFFQHLCRQGIGIAFQIVDSFNTGIDEHLGADDTGEIGTIQNGATNTDAMICSLNNSVLFGMKAAAKLMPLA